MGQHIDGVLQKTFDAVLHSIEHKDSVHERVPKQKTYFSVRELVKKVESHPHRQALQADLQQNNAYNPFSDESKAMIREMGNVELFELCETIPKVAVLRMPSSLESRNCLWHLWTSLERK